MQLVSFLAQGNCFGSCEDFTFPRGLMWLPGSVDSGPPAGLAAVAAARTAEAGESLTSVMRALATMSYDSFSRTFTWPPSKVSVFDLFALRLSSLWKIGAHDNPLYFWVPNNSWCPLWQWEKEKQSISNVEPEDDSALWVFLSDISCNWEPWSWWTISSLEFICQMLMDR